MIFGFASNSALAACGSSNGGTFAFPPTTNLCSIDTSPSSVVTNPTTFTWSCYYDCCNSGSWVDRSAGTPKASAFYDEVAISATGQYQAIGDNGDVFVSSDFGLTWTKYDNLVNGVGANCANVKGLVISEAGQNQIMACDTGIFYSTNYGQNWTRSGTISGFISLDSSPSGQYLVANSASNIYTSSDYGQTWIAIIGSVGAYSNKIYASAISSDGTKIAVLGQASITKEGLFYGTYSGSWTFIKKSEYSLGAFSTYKDIDMSADGKYISFPYHTAINGYRVYYSSDFGSSFLFYSFGAVNYVKKIEMSASGRCQMASVGIGSVYVSSDYGASWSSALSSSLGVDIAMSASGLYKAAVGSDAMYAYLANPSTNCFSSDSCSAISSSIINGVCGSDDGQTFTSAPASNLCSAGLATSVTSNTSTYTWDCTGSGGGATVNCDATRNYLVTYTSTAGGSCVPASRTVAYNATSAAPTCTPNVGYSLNNFTRTSGGGGTLNSATGEVTNVTGSQTIQANFIISVNGSCGSAHDHGYSSTAEIDLASERCNSGSFTSFVDAGATWTWQCTGSGGGSTANCFARKVAVGSASGKIFKNEPIANLCLYGNATPRTLISDIWYWACTDNPGVDAIGFTYKTTCGSSNGGTFSSPPASNLCKYGGASLVSTNPLTYDWTCTGNDSLTVSCSAVRTGVNGVCGSDDGKVLSSSPINLCSSGTPTGISGTYSWQCTGSGGGTTADCSAEKITFINPFDFIADENCWYCEYYLDDEGNLKKGKIVDGNAILELRFSLTTIEYNYYKIGIGTNNISPLMQTVNWMSFSGEPFAVSVTKSGSDYSTGNSLYITYGNGINGKEYYWFVKLKNSLTGEETDWVPSLNSFSTPKKPFPVVRIKADKTTVVVGSDVQYCSTVDSLERSGNLTATSLKCFDVCWQGTGTTAVLTSDNWKCSICYDNTGNPSLCTTNFDQNKFSWNLSESAGTYISPLTGLPTADSDKNKVPNPIFRYTSLINVNKPILVIKGSDCASEGEAGIKIPLPIWRESQ